MTACTTHANSVAIAAAAQETALSTLDKKQRRKEPCCKNGTLKGRHGLLLDGLCSNRQIMTCYEMERYLGDGRECVGSDRAMNHPQGRFMHSQQNFNKALTDVNSAQYTEM
jgi:hypothetical protein